MDALSNLLKQKKKLTRYLQYTNLKYLKRRTLRGFFVILYYFTQEDKKNFQHVRAEETSQEFQLRLNWINFVLMSYILIFALCFFLGIRAVDVPVEDGIFVLRDENFGPFLAEHDFVFVEFYVWCLYLVPVHVFLIFEFPRRLGVAIVKS